MTSNTSRKSGLDGRLDAYAATLRSSRLQDLLKRSAGNWQVYAAVTGSALAMAMGASAAALHGDGDEGVVDSYASARAVSLHLASSRNVPLTNMLKSANMTIGRQDSGATATVQAPAILPAGIVPLYSTASTIQPGEWVSIYGNNLAAADALWNNDFPVSLGGTSVTINGKPAYLLSVSPGQINLQAPDDTATGTVAVVVTTAGGSATSTVTLSPYAPSFSLVDGKHVSGIILRTDGSGAYGGGTYDILGPQGTSLGFQTVAARAGDSVVLFGFGFGPTTPAVPAGSAFSGAASIDSANPLSFYVGNAIVKTSFVGLSSAGLYQINLQIPYGLGTGDIPIHAGVGGLQTQAGVMIPVNDPFVIGSGNPGTVVMTSTHPPVFFSSDPPPPTSGGNASSLARRAHYLPGKLKFPEAK